MTSLVLSVSNVPLALRTSWGLLAELAQVPMASALRRTETSGSVQYSATSVGASTALAQLLPALDDEVDLSGITGEQQQLFHPSSDCHHWKPRS